MLLVNYTEHIHILIFILNLIINKFVFNKLFCSKNDYLIFLIIFITIILTQLFK